MHGVRVIVTDLEDGRLARARNWGAAAVSARLLDVRERILVHCDRGADIVIETSGSDQGAELGETLLRGLACAY